MESRGKTHSSKVSMNRGFYSKIDIHNLYTSGRAVREANEGPVFTHHTILSTVIHFAHSLVKQIRKSPASKTVFCVHSSSLPSSLLLVSNQTQNESASEKSREIYNHAKLGGSVSSCEN